MKGLKYGFSDESNVLLKKLKIGWKIGWRLIMFNFFYKTLALLTNASNSFCRILKTRRWYSLYVSNL